LILTRAPLAADVTNSVANDSLMSFLAAFKLFHVLSISVLKINVFITQIIIIALHYYDDQIKKNELGGSCSTLGRHEKCIQSSFGNHKKKR
jgi:hypothetical protein